MPPHPVGSPEFVGRWRVAADGNPTVLSQPGVENKPETRMDCSDFAVAASSSRHRGLLSLTGQQPD
jgi:hypothetical protein